MDPSAWGTRDRAPNSDATKYVSPHGLNPLGLGMVWVFGSAGKIFVYQSAVLIIGYSFGYFKSRDLLRLGILLTLVEFAAILLIVPFYWPLIGVR